MSATDPQPEPLIFLGRMPVGLVMMLALDPSVVLLPLDLTGGTELRPWTPEPEQETRR